MEGVMKLQEVFDKVAQHLLKQCKQSSNRYHLDAGDEPTCLYRGPDGLKCAVGCLIDDKAYHQGLEGSSVLALDVREALSASGIPVSHGLTYEAEQDPTVQLLSALQSIHDNRSPKDWHSQLWRVAKEFRLTWSQAA